MGQTTNPARTANQADRAASIEQQPIRRPQQPSQSPADAKGKPVGASGGLDVTRVLMALGIVVGLAVAGRFLVRWLFPAVAAARSSSAVRVLSRSVIAPKQQLLLVQVGRRVIVVGDSGAQLSPLAQIDEPDEVAGLLAQLESEKRPSARAFGSLFGRAQEKFDEAEVKASDPRPEADEASLLASDSGQDHLMEKPAAEPVGVELGYSAAREQISGLTERVRQLAQKFGSS